MVCSMGMVQAQLRVDSGEVACDSISLVVVFQFCGLYVCGGPCFDILSDVSGAFCCTAHFVYVGLYYISHFVHSFRVFEEVKGE